ncbi:MAG: SDR family oxidoreductase [Cyanobacteria bacterium P01_F01_bin.56]
MESRVVLLTGATGKLGRQLTAHLLGQGHRVIATGRSPESLTALQHFVDNTENLISLQVDFLADDTLTVFLEDLSQLSSAPDVIINNARSIDTLSINEDGTVSRQNFLDEFLLDVVIPYELTMGIHQLKLSRLRSVVNIGSIYGVVAANPSLYEDPVHDSPIHYSVAKAALAHLTRELAVRLAPQDIQVNCVAYGGVEGRVDKKFQDQYARLCPQGRMLSELDITGPIDFLLSASSTAMTGQVLVVDGGWSVW